MVVPTVFISSTILDLGPERDAAERAIASMGFRTLRAESLGSRTEPPHEACLDMVRSSDVYLGIYGSRYGWVHPELGVSATELEFLEARRLFKHLLVYIKAADARDVEQAAFVSRVQNFDRGVFTRPPFENADQLAEWIRADLVVLTGKVFSIASGSEDAITHAEPQPPWHGDRRGTPVYINPVPSLGEDEYVTRTDVLDLIDRNHQTARKAVLVQGVGGAGKTVVAQSYANLPRYAQKYNLIAWVNASGNLVDAVINDLHGPLCGQKRELIGDRDADYRSVVREMLSTPGRNLLVIDGVDRPNDMSQSIVQLTRTRWDVLITSRCKVAEFALVSVDEMSTSDATELFHRFCSKPHTDKALLELLDVLGRHAFLTELLARLVARKSNLSVENCLALLEPAQLLDLAAMGLPSLPSETYAVDVERRLLTLLVHDDLTEQERILLRGLSALPNYTLGFDVLEKLLLSDVGSKDVFHSALRSLDSKGWTRMVGASVRTHPLAQSISLRKSPPDVDNSKALILALETAVTFRDSQIDRPIEWIPFCETLFSRVSGRSPELASLAARTGLLFEATGEYEKAIQYHLFALDVRAEAFGTEHLETAKSQDQTGLCWVFVGNLALGEAKILSGLEVRTRLLETSALELASSWNNLGFARRRQGRSAEALKCYQHALDIYAQEERPSYGHALACNNVSIAYRDLNDITLALDFAFRALRLREGSLSPEHPSFGNSYNSIASLLLSQGKIDQAVEFAERSVGFRDAILPPFHPDLAVSLHTLAKAYSAAGDNARARQTIGRALHIFRQSLRQDHALVTRATADAVAMGHPRSFLPE